MKTNIKILLSVWLIIGGGSVFAQKYANEFLYNQRVGDKREIIYFKGADNLLKTNINKLYQADDSVVLAVFNNEIVNEMSFLGFAVKPITEFKDSLTANEHTLEISQIEAEEYNFYDSVTDYENDNLKFYKELSGIRLNVWLTFDGQLQSEKIIFYNSNEIRDDLEGYFEDDNGGNPYVNYSITEINPNDLYMITTYNADECAKYFFNFLLNRYVWMKTNGEDKNYYGVTKQRTLKTKKYPFDCFEILE